MTPIDYVNISNAVLRMEPKSFLEGCILALAESLPDGLTRSNRGLAKDLVADRTSVIRTIKRLMAAGQLVNTGENGHRKLVLACDSRSHVTAGNMLQPVTVTAGSQTCYSQSPPSIKRKKVKKLSCPNSVELRLATLLWDLIQQRKPDYKKPNIDDWAKDIGLMIRRDSRKPDQIAAVIRWCQSDSFWQNNILSPSKLRKQFDQLVLKMRQPVRPGGKPTPPAGPEIDSRGLTALEGVRLQQGQLTDGEADQIGRKRLRERGLIHDEVPA